MEDSAAPEPTPLRRSKRRCSVISPTKDTAETSRPSVENLTVQTPSRRNKKRVRFSEPTPRLVGGNTTGLTPAIRRSSLGTPKRSTSSPIPESGEYQFTPFRQQLTERCQRRIRRNGLSEEMNQYESERKDKARLEKEVREKDEELKKLREQLQLSREAATHNAHDDVSSSQHIDEVEAELEALRQSFNEVDSLPPDDAFLADDGMVIDWSQVHVGGNSGPRSDGGDTIPIHEDDDAILDNIPHPREIQQDVTLLGMALDLESAKKEKRRLFQDVRRHIDAPGTTLNFADSPGQRTELSSDSLASLPSPPRDFYQNLSKTLKATTQRAEAAEEALQALENEVTALGFPAADASTSLTSIATQFRETRLALERAMPGETACGLRENAELLPELIAKLHALMRHIGDREAELKSLREQHRSLTGNFAHAIRAAETAGQRARELEEGADGAAGEMLEVRMRCQRLERDNGEKDKNVERLVAALEKYREDVRRLEELVAGMEREAAERAVEQAQALSDLDARVAAEMMGRRAAEESAVERLERIHGLEARLKEAKDDAGKIEEQLKTLQRSIVTDSDAHAQQLGGLNSRISGLSTALASANAEVDKLKVVKRKLEERVRSEVEQGQTAVEAMQMEVEKALIKASEKRKGYVRASKVRVANSEIEDDEAFSSDGPMTPASMVRFVDVEQEEGDHVDGEVVMGRGKKRASSLGLGISKGGRRRRYDSGIGMDTLSEEEMQEAFESSDGELMTPELSSEADFDIHEDQAAISAQ